VPAISKVYYAPSAMYVVFDNAPSAMYVVFDTAPPSVLKLKLPVEWPEAKVPALPRSI
jgi:hypothetical protein